jgi:hypothetical protein
MTLLYYAVRIWHHSALLDEARSSDASDAVFPRRKAVLNDNFSYHTDRVAAYPGTAAEVAGAERQGLARAVECQKSRSATLTPSCCIPITTVLSPIEPVALQQPWVLYRCICAPMRIESCCSSSAFVARFSACGAEHGIYIVSGHNQPQMNPRCDSSLPSPQQPFTPSTALRPPLRLDRF